MDKLFLLNPGFLDSSIEPDGQLYFCPYCAMIGGMLSYYPDLRDQLEIHYLDFQRPRKMIIELLGGENQGCPLLIADESSEIDFIPFNRYGNYRFINNVKNIAQFLSYKFQILLPHF
jgi:Protein of unknown function (DUF3088)